MYIHEGHTTHLQVGIQREKLKGQPLQVMGIYTIYDSVREEVVKVQWKEEQGRTRENKGEQGRRTMEEDNRNRNNGK